ncbi:MAG: hypothetical protein MPI95_03805 [Nitrosopumilus sp.]|nr:hypothetical protein [Nitrosopumilus sp.]CAI9830853.1 conserved exported hypothetical protein [Nitrosopumilaceae archaeon]MDA7941108.1 hypothetical protein [Nitrosopumilus sp.]MDA7942494.1 hypothetical protein [Nitrosopumilus sp.]MDA7944547.1 hypothetical protein [Nitrosopumilus sp.]
MRPWHVAVLAALALAPAAAHAHTVDAVGGYRVEIGWLNSPVVAGEANGIVLLVSPLDRDADLIDQGFNEGITGLRKTLKMQLVLGEQSVTLPLTVVQEVPGKYYAAVNPSESGYYQANVLGDIRGTPVNLSMHPPKVGDAGVLVFPPPDPAGDGPDLASEVAGLSSEIQELRGIVEGMGTGAPDASYAGIAAGAAGLGVAAIALARSRR